ncbi:hypothetical protein HDR66_03520 [bacterium]|nr:hypothetical protein [bacterium]
MSISTYMSDLILNATTATVGVSIPDTCAAIKSYATANISPNAIIDATAAADMICVPTRLSGFFYTGIAAGWKLMIGAIGHSVLTFIMGTVLIVIFLINLWKFTLMGLGVIADLFLAIFMLPFTAIAETVAKTKYDGIAGNIFNEFLTIFNTQSLSKQIERFINAAVFFVSISIVIAVCMALLSGVMNIDVTDGMVTINNEGIMMTLLVACLVGYLADKAKSITGDLGGSVDDSIGQQFGQDIVGTTKNIGKQAQTYWKLYKESKK